MKHSILLLFFSILLQTVNNQVFSQECTPTLEEIYGFPQGAIFQTREIVIKGDSVVEERVRKCAISDKWVYDTVLDYSTRGQSMERRYNVGDSDKGEWYSPNLTVGSQTIKISEYAERNRCDSALVLINSYKNYYSYVSTDGTNWSYGGKDNIYAYSEDSVLELLPDSISNIYHAHYVYTKGLGLTYSFHLENGYSRELFLDGYVINEDTVGTIDTNLVIDYTPPVIDSCTLTFNDFFTTPAGSVFQYTTTEYWEASIVVEFKEKYKEVHIWRSNDTLFIHKKGLSIYSMYDAMYYPYDDPWETSIDTIDYVETIVDSPDHLYNMCEGELYEIRKGLFTYIQRDSTTITIGGYRNLYKYTDDSTLVLTDPYEGSGYHFNPENLYLTEIYKKGVGFYSSTEHYYHSFTEENLNGYIIDGDTIGYVDEDIDISFVDAPPHCSPKLKSLYNIQMGDVFHARKSSVSATLPDTVTDYLYSITDLQWNEDTLNYIITGKERTQVLSESKQFYTFKVDDFSDTITIVDSITHLLNLCDSTFVLSNLDSAIVTTTSETKTVIQFSENTRDTTEYRVNTGVVSVRSNKMVYELIGMSSGLEHFGMIDSVLFNPIIDSVDTCKVYTWIDGVTYETSTDTPTFQAIDSMYVRRLALNIDDTFDWGSNSEEVIDTLENKCCEDSVGGTKDENEIPQTVLINELEFSNIFPIPVEGNLHILLQAINAELIVDIFTLDGTMVNTFQYFNVSEVVLDFSECNSNVFILKLKSSDKDATFLIPTKH